jgi:hypothetical protein
MRFSTPFRISGLSANRFPLQARFSPLFPTF